MTCKETPNADRVQSRFPYGYIVVIAAFSIMAVSWAAYNSFGIFFKPMSDDFGWDRAVTSGAFSISMFIYGILGIAFGMLNDRFGPRVVLTVCGVILGLGYLLMSQVNSIWQLYLFLGLIIGVGMSGVWVPLLSTVARWFIQRRTLMSGIVIAGLSIGGMVGSPIISLFIINYGWPTSYIIIGITVMVAVIIASQFLRRPTDQARQSVEYEKILGTKLPRFVNYSFSFNEAVRTSQFWITSGLFFVFGYETYTIAVHIVPHATDIGILPVAAANILAIRGAVSILGNYTLGALADRTGNRKIFIIGFIMLSAILFYLSLTNEKWILYLFIVIFGFAVGGMGASESPLVAWLFGTGSHGLIYGVVHVGFTLGAAAGPFVTGYIFDRTGTYQLAFLACAVLSVIGVILTIVLKPTKISIKA